MPDFNLVTLARSLCFGPPRPIVCHECGELRDECRCDPDDFTPVRTCAICDAEISAGRYCEQHQPYRVPGVEQGQEERA